MRKKIKACKKIFHANSNKKRAGVAILISNKIDFKLKTVTRDKERHHILTKGSIHPEAIILINVHTENNRIPNCKELKGEIDNSIIIVRDFNTSLSLWIEHPNRRSLRK